VPVVNIKYIYPLNHVELGVPVHLECLPNLVLTSCPGLLGLRKTVAYDTSDVIDPDTIMMVFNEGIFAKTLLQGRGICKP
jgi:hypothetical protein